MKSLLLLLAFIMCSIASIHVHAQTIGIFNNAIDVGNPAEKGTSNYDESSEEYRISGGGYNIWFERDEFHFLHKELAGDFILTANFDFVGEGVDLHRKVGWMVRESLNEEASHISATLHGDGLTVLQWRALRGAYMRDPEDQLFSPKSNYSILQLERKGHKYIMRAAHEGEPLQVIGSKEMDHLPDSVLAGLFICAHNPNVIEEAIVWNVRIDKPHPENYDAYRSGFGHARLEIMNVNDGRRKVIYTSDEGFEAPNWMPDGKHLIFNMKGSIFDIALDGGVPEKVYTGQANRNNNDHGISFNKKMLAISSSHRNDLDGGGSAIYVVPLEGGEPQLVTRKTPSYWHGWNPNNREVVYVAKRSEDEPYNIYSANIKTEEERQITKFNVGHVDGPEFSPDGKNIYYNGSQSGTMQIWRMKPNGSENEQLTFDHLNKWFPHISPDGRWMVYIAFPSEIPVDSHPPLQRVTLYLMPSAGGAARALAYLYGGQGTINVPSWSPDSKRIAFVSYSGRD